MIPRSPGGTTPKLRRCTPEIGGDAGEKATLLFSRCCLFFFSHFAFRTVCDNQLLSFMCALCDRGGPSPAHRFLQREREGERDAAPLLFCPLHSSPALNFTSSLAATRESTPESLAAERHAPNAAAAFPCRCLAANVFVLLDRFALLLFCSTFVTSKFRVAHTFSSRDQRDNRNMAASGRTQLQG